jgi:hypothetical protein
MGWKLRTWLQPSSKRSHCSIWSKSWSRLDSCEFVGMETIIQIECGNDWWAQRRSFCSKPRIRDGCNIVQICFLRYLTTVQILVQPVLRVLICAFSDCVLRILYAWEVTASKRGCRIHPAENTRDLCNLTLRVCCFVQSRLNVYRACVEVVPTEPGV